MGRWIVFVIFAGFFGCQAYIADKGSREDLSRQPTRDELAIVEGRLTDVTIEPCKYTRRVRRPPRDVCIDVYNPTIVTPAGPRTLEMPPHIAHRLNSLEEWQALIGQPIRIALAPCPYYNQIDPCTYDLQIGDDQLVSYDLTLKNIRGAGLAMMLFSAAWGIIILLIVALAPFPDPPPPPTEDKRTPAV